MGSLHVTDFDLHYSIIISHYSPERHIIQFMSNRLVACCFLFSNDHRGNICKQGKSQHYMTRKYDLENRENNFDYSRIVHPLWTFWHSKWSIRGNVREQMLIKVIPRQLWNYHSIASYCNTCNNNIFPYYESDSSNHL